MRERYTRSKKTLQEKKTIRVNIRRESEAQRGARRKAGLDRTEAEKESRVAIRMLQAGRRLEVIDALITDSKLT